LTEEIDKWAATNGDIGRSEAMRRLVELGLKAKGKVPTAAPPPGKPR